MRNTLAILCCVATFGAASCYAEPARPNIVFIFADDIATKILGAYGGTLIETPNIDRLAEQGVRFDNVFCENSICGPSRAAVLTGQHSHRTGFRTNYSKFDDRHITYPEVFKNAGYQTALIGKTHLLPNNKALKSFDYFKKWSMSDYNDPKFYTREQGWHQEKGYLTEIVTDTAIDWVEKRDPEKPFLLMVHHPAAHMPFGEDPAYLATFKDHTFPLPASFRDPTKNRRDSPRPPSLTLDGLMDFQGRPNLKGGLREQNWVAPEGLEGDARDQWVYQRLMKAYANCVTSLDHHTGRLMHYLDKEGLLDNTIVVFSADQGFFLGDHGWYDKRLMYDEPFRMPLIVRVPGTTGAGTSNPMLLSNIDYAPTFLEMAGLSVPDVMQGRSFLPMLKGEHPDNWRKSVYYHYYEDQKNSPLPVQKHYGVRTDRHKLIRFYGRPGIPPRWELYDLDKDPHEMNDVSNDPAYAEVLSSLKRELARLRKANGDGSGPAIDL